MKNISLLVYSFITCMFFLSSCEIIGDIFKAGVWVGILLVGVILVGVIFILSKIFNRK